MSRPRRILVTLCACALLSLSPGPPAVTAVADPTTLVDARGDQQGPSPWGSIGPARKVPLKKHHRDADLVRTTVAPDADRLVVRIAVADLVGPRRAGRFRALQRYSVEFTIGEGRVDPVGLFSVRARGEGLREPRCGATTYRVRFRYRADAVRFVFPHACLRSELEDWVDEDFRIRVTSSYDILKRGGGLFWDDRSRPGVDWTFPAA